MQRVWSARRIARDRSKSSPEPAVVLDSLLAVADDKDSRLAGESGESVEKSACMRGNGCLGAVRPVGAQPIESGHTKTTRAAQDNRMVVESELRSCTDSAFAQNCLGKHTTKKNTEYNLSSTSKTKSCWSFASRTVVV